MKKFCLLLFLLISVLYLCAEVRSLWVLPWNITSPQAVDRVISDALSSNQNELLVEVRYRADALYTPNRLGNKYYNPEPRSYILQNDGFDPLAYTLQQAHAHNLKVQAWVIVFNATPTARELVEQNYIFNNYPHWITYNEQGNQMRSSEAFGYFIDPGLPEVQDYLLDVISDIVNGYPQLDGLHLDYIRYPSSQWGFHPISVSRFEDTKENGEMISWNEWRIRQVTEFVSKCSIRVKSINPNLMLSAAVFSNISEARISYAQDWYDWLKKGIVDRVYPMAYHLDYNVFSNQLDEMLYYGLEQNLVIGLRAWNANGKSLMPKDNPEYNLEHIIKRINRIREGKFGGIALFSHHSITQNGALDSLALLSYPPIENKLPIEPMYTEENAADVKVNLVAGTYVIEIMLPKEGKWFWSISDTNNTLIYNKQRFYFKGLNQEFWNGKLINGTYIAPGNYIFTVFHEDANYKYMIPISLDSIVHE